MKLRLYKRNILAIISICIIYFSMNIAISSMSLSYIFHPILFSLLRNSATLPLVLAAAITEGIYNSISDKHKPLKLLIIALFVAFALTTQYIDNEIINYRLL